jgi:hypothetical protein
MMYCVGLFCKMLLNGLCNKYLISDPEEAV